MAVTDNEVQHVIKEVAHTAAGFTYNSPDNVQHVIKEVSHAPNGFIAAGGGGGSQPSIIKRIMQMDPVVQ